MFGRVRVPSLQAIIYAAPLVTLGASWIPLATIGGVRLEIANIGALGAAAIPVWLLARGRPVRVPLYAAWYFALLVVLACGFVFNGTVDAGKPIIVMSLPVAFMLAGLASLTPRLIEYLPRIAIVSLGVTIAFLLMASVLVGIPLLRETSLYISDLDRGRFMFLVMRPIMNAFAANESGGLFYVGSEINSIAATVALSTLIAGARALASSRRRWLYLAVALIGTGIVVILFSSASMLILACCAVPLSIIACRKWPAVTLLLAFGAMAALLVVLANDAAPAYLGVNIANDDRSWTGRWEQYIGILDYIDDRVLLGNGIVEIDETVVHNLPLFAWSSAGIVGFIFALGMYAIAIRFIWRGFRAAYADPSDFAAIVMMTLPILYIVRSMVGGGGGVGDSAALLSLGVAGHCSYVVRRPRVRFGPYPRRRRLNLQSRGLAPTPLLPSRPMP